MRHYTGSWLAILRDNTGNILYEPTRIMKFLGHESLETTIRYIHSFARGKTRIKNKLKKKYENQPETIDDRIKNCPTSELPKLIIRLHLQGKIDETQLDKYLIVLGIKNRD